MLALCGNTIDPENSLGRAHASLDESIGFMTSYANSRRLIGKYEEVHNIRSKLELLMVRLENLLSQDDAVESTSKLGYSGIVHSNDKSKEL